jgi:preprotein translocase subunit SecE
MADNKAAAKKAKKPNVFVRLLNYLRACWGEIKKITWTNPKTATKNFFVVLVVIIVCGLFIFGLDRLLYFLLDLVMNTTGG